MTTDRQKVDLDRLRSVLDAHGANPARWPATDASRLAALASSAPQMRRMLRQAEALDKVLASAPARTGTDVDAIADLIMARAKAGSGSALAVGAKIVDLPVRQTRFRYWPVVTALAASLMIGIYVGSAGFPVPGLMQVADLSKPDADNPMGAMPAAAEDTEEGEIL